MITQLREKIEAIDLRQFNLRDMIDLAEEHGVKTSYVAELIEQRGL